jgi:Ran GTPase-activating protein (RanGAP) involved in mRNA processing and transport
MSVGFDYHLTEPEQKKVERMVPLHQAKIHMAFRADVTIDDKKFKQGAVALSEHLIVIAKKGVVGKGFAHVRTVHLLDIYSFSTVSNLSCRLAIEHEPEMLMIHVASDCCIRFARILLRNYYVISRPLPQKQRFQFRPHDMNEFPPFDPKMSPSQTFQFFYNAQCSYANSTYEHAVTQLYHSMVVMGNGIADLTRLPLRIIEINFGRALDLGPLFTAMKYSPIIHGVRCYEVTRPDIARAVAPLIALSTRLSLVDIHGCHCELGSIELSEAIRVNPRSDVVYWDLSDNDFSDMSAFCAALAATRADVFYLNLSRCGMNTESTGLLMRAMDANRHLWKVRHILLAGAKFTEDSARTFRGYIEALAADEKLRLKTLDISDTGYYDLFLDTLNQFQPPLEALYIGRATFANGRIDSLLSLVSRSLQLKELGLRGSQLQVEQVCQIIWAISKNENITSIYLDLSKAKLNGKRLRQVLDQFKSSNHNKWTRLGFDENEMTTSDLKAALKLFRQLLNLRSLSIGGNFNRKNKALPQMLAELLTIPTLQHLSLVGQKNCFLGKSILPLLEQLKGNGTLLSLDLSNNRIGDAGVGAVCSVLETNQVLTEVRVEGSHITSMDVFTRLLRFLGSDGNVRIQLCPFPLSDFYELVHSTKDAKKSSLFELVDQLQGKAQQVMQVNQNAVGMHSDLSKKGLAELNELLDTVTIAVHEAFDGIAVTEHAALAGAFGLPFPHRDDVDKDAADADGGGETPYGIPGQRVVEDRVTATEGLASLQFNSLCIRRPDARGQIAKQTTSEFVTPDAEETPEKLGPSAMPDFDVGTE